MAKRKPPVLSLTEQLRTVPIRNARAEVTREGDALRVTVPLVYPGVVQPLRRILKLREKKSFELEGVGRAVFEKVDDKTRVEELIDWFAAEHALSFHESRALLLGYLRTLMEKGLIVIAGLEREREDASK